MANPWHHAVSSSRKWGGDPQDYLHIHEWFDATKGWLPDFRHRAIRHHSEGIAQCVELFDPIVIATTFQSDYENVRRSTKIVPVRWVAEQHVKEDCGRIPTAADWLRNLNDFEPWMTNPRKLSKELDDSVDTGARSSA